METGTIIAGIGIGTIISSVITFFGNHYLNKGNYKREHYSYLITKRIEAYNFVEDVLTSLDETTQIRQNDKLIYMGYKVFIFINEQKNHCDILLEKFSKYNVYKNWLSPECADNMAEIYGNLSHIENNREKSKDEVIIIYTPDFAARIKELKEKAIKTYHKDILKLHQIEGFIKQKNKNNNYSIYLDSSTIEAMQRTK